MEQARGIARIIRAATFVRERDHASNLGKLLLKFSRAKVIAHIVRDGCRAIHAGDHGEIVARTHFAAGPRESVKGALLGGGMIFDRPGVGAKCVIKTQRPEVDIVRMHVLTRLDVVPRKPDRLAVLENARAPRDLGRGHLVPGWNGGAQLQRRTAIGNASSRFQRAPRDDDIIGRVQTKHGLVWGNGGS